MRISDTLCKLIYGTGAFPAYMIGKHVANRWCWMEKARASSDRTLRTLLVGFARQSNRSLIAEFKEFRKRNPEAP